MSRSELHWCALGINREMTGIERLAIMFLRQAVQDAPDVTHVLHHDHDAAWVVEAPPAVALSPIPRRPGNVLFPHLFRAGAIHSFSNVLVPFPRAARRSFTIHDWGPITDRTMPIRARFAWQRTIEVNLRTCGVVHLTLPSLYEHAPPHLRRILDRRELVFGAPAPNFVTAPREPVDAPYFLSVGTNVPRKRYGALIEAWGKLRGSTPDVPELRIVGAGTDQLPTVEGVKVFGRVSEAELGRLVAHCAGLISVSEYEGLNLPVREALAHGRGVVATRSAVPGLEEEPGVALIREVTPDELAAGLAVMERPLPSSGFSRPGYGADSLIESLISHLRSTK